MSDRNLAIVYGRRQVLLAAADVERLRGKALARAGTSATLRDLGVRLAEGLTPARPLLLRRGEARALHALLVDEAAGGPVGELRELVAHAAALRRDSSGV